MNSRRLFSEDITGVYYFVRLLLLSLKGLESECFFSVKVVKGGVFTYSNY